MWETSVQSLGWEDTLQKGMATHSSILAWRIPQTVYYNNTRFLPGGWSKDVAKTGATRWRIWFRFRLQIGKGVCQGCILYSCMFNLYAEYIVRNAGLDEAQTEIKISGRSINNLIYTDDTTLMEESKEKLKSLLIKWKRRVKSWLKIQHSKNEDYSIPSHYFMANRWGNNGNNDRLYFLGL